MLGVAHGSRTSAANKAPTGKCLIEKQSDRNGEHGRD